MPTLELTLEQAESLRRAATLGCVLSDIRSAADRYPGDLNCDVDLFWDGPLDDIASKNVRRIALENAYFSLSFVLRLVEQRWSAEQVRRDVTEALPLLVRAPRGFAARIGAPIAALDRLIACIPPDPEPGAIGDPDVFGRFCKGRDTIAAVVEALDHLDALKTLHDALHLLQVLGAAWLDPLPAGGAVASATTPPSAQLLYLEDVAAKVMDRVPSDMTACCIRCLEACQDARALIAGEDPDGPAYARAALLTLLREEQPLIDDAMFAVSRDLPLRAFAKLFTDPDARLAVVDLGDTLRRRLMEHALWQSTDRRLYVIEQVLLASAPQLNKLLDKQFGLPWTIYNLRLLFDQETNRRVIVPMNDKILRCFDPGAKGQEAAGGTLEDVRGAFAALRDAARSAFITVDQALKEDVARLLDLQAPLRTVLDRVPPLCELMLSE